MKLKYFFIYIFIFIFVLFVFGCANVKEIKHGTFEEKNQIDESAKIDNYLEYNQYIVVRFLCYKNGEIKINNVYPSPAYVNDSMVYEHRKANGVNKKDSKYFIDYIKIGRDYNYACYGPNIGMKDQDAISVFYTYKINDPINSILTTAFMPLTLLTLDPKQLPKYTTHQINNETEKMIGKIIVTKLSKELAMVYGRMPSDRLKTLINKYQSLADYNLKHDSIDNNKLKNYVFVDYKSISGSYTGSTRLFDGVKVANGYGIAKGNQIRYEGDFVNGKMHGMGTIIVGLGSDYEVYWKNEGKGRVENGLFYLKGYFEDNELVYECNSLRGYMSHKELLRKKEFEELLNKMSFEENNNIKENIEKYNQQTQVIENKQEDDEELRRRLQKRLEEIEL